MVTNAYRGKASELRSRSRDLAFAVPRSAAVVRGLAQAVQDKVSLSFGELGPRF
jgi:hypothetical protein